jgi:hypothetical protein
MRRALWIVGPPAAGKTTAARTWLGFDAGLGGSVELVQKPKWSLAFNRRIVAAGHYTGETFDGADRVPYNGARDALAYWLRELQPRAELTIFDGDRFSNAGVLEFVKRYVDRVECQYVETPEHVRDERIGARGWNPDPRWVRGRETKARHFRELFT